MGDIRRDGIRSGILALGLGLLPAAAELLGLGSWSVLLFLLAVPSGIAALLAVLIILLRKRRDTWMRIAITCGLFALFAFPCIKLSLKSRMVAFGWLAFRSDELVLAIASYEQKTGAPPSSLQSLVPDYLEEVPSRACPPTQPSSTGSIHPKRQSVFIGTILALAAGNRSVDCGSTSTAIVKTPSSCSLSHAMIKSASSISIEYPPTFPNYPLTRRAGEATSHPESPWSLPPPRHCNPSASIYTTSPTTSANQPATVCW
jgi:hypothetical protein